MIGTRLRQHENRFEVPGAFTISDLHPGGERFAIVHRSDATAPEQINVFQNWLEELNLRFSVP